MAEQFGWSDSAKGAISSSFFVGYTVTNLIGDTLAHICLDLSNLDASSVHKSQQAVFFLYFQLPLQLQLQACMLQWLAAQPQAILLNLLCTQSYLQLRVDLLTLQVVMLLQSTLPSKSLELGWCCGPYSQSSHRQQLPLGSCSYPCLFPGELWGLGRGWHSLPSPICLRSTNFPKTAMGTICCWCHSCFLHLAE